MNVCPELDDVRYIAGRKFTHDEKSIILAAGDIPKNFARASIDGQNI
jgi:hypothetical protein